MALPAPATIVITGGSSGIGAAVACRLARPDRTIHLLGRDEDRLASVAEDVRRRGAVPHRHTVDLVDNAALRRSLDRLTDRLPTLDALVHSAGWVTLNSVERADLDDLDRMYAVNLRAPFALTSALAPALREARGQVVFINSGLGQTARAEWSQYAATKFGLRALADAFRLEVEPQGVRVTTVYPGRTATPMQAEVHRQEGRVYDPDSPADADDVASSVEHVLDMPRTAVVQEVTVRHRHPDAPRS